jgi:hypothetical protein
MRGHNLRERCQWCLALMVWAIVAAVVCLIIGGLFGLIYGTLLGAVRGNTELAAVLAGRGAIAGLVTGAMLGALAKITAGGTGDAGRIAQPDQSSHSVASLNGAGPVSGALGTKSRIGSR